MTKAKVKEHNQSLNDEEANHIRKAYKAGKKTVMVHGKRMRIEKKSKRVKYAAAGETRTRRESWLHVSPADGSLTPIVQIEIKKGDNIRSDV